MKKINNNDILKKHLRENDYSKVLGVSGDQLAKAGRPQLIDWVDRLSGTGTAQRLINENDARNASLASSATPVQLTNAEEKLKAMQELLGGGSVDEDQVRDIVIDVVKEDVSPIVSEIKEKVDALSPLAETLEKIADAMVSKTNSRLPIATAVASGSNPILEMVAPFYKAGSTNPTKICISAPPSYGKSYSVGLLGASYDKFITHGCSGDMDEWSMLLGSCTPKKEGGFITTDGSLAEAVRSASDGKDTLFFLDEVFRMSPSTMESMLAFLAPQPDANGDLVYRLTTKHNDHGVLETLTCKADKLHIICATNLSEVTPPEAFMDRFLFKHIRFSVDFIKQVAQSVADRYSIADGDVLASKFAEAMGASRTKHGTGQILKPLSIRDLERGCVHASDATKDSVVQWITENGLDGLLMWNSDTGDIVEDSEAGVKQIADILV